MRYIDLKRVLDNLSDTELNQDVSVHVDDEYYPVRCATIINETDVLDAGHIVLSVE